MKTKKWFDSKMNEFKDDPEFLREYISLLIRMNKAQQELLVCYRLGVPPQEATLDFFGNEDS